MKLHTRSGFIAASIVFMLMLITLVLPGKVMAVTGSINSCNACHNYPPDDSATRDSGTGAFTGNHGTHFSANNCQACHNSVGASEYNHSIKSSVAGVNYINMTGVIHRSRMGAAAKYNKGLKFAQSSTPALSNCSNVNCHFESATPTWGQASPWSSTKTANNNDANCAQCHASTGLSSGKHTKHIAAGGGTLTACSKCHPDYNALAGTAAFAHTSSVGSPITINFSAAPNLGGTYAGGRTGSDFLPSAAVTATGTCSALYCHSPGNKASSYDLPNTTPVTWATSLDCKGCHKAEAFSGAEMSSGSHQAHINNALAYTAIKCVTCHAVTANANMTISDVSKHVNKFVDVAFNNTSSAANGLYAGAPATKASPSSRAPGSAPGNCQNVYCHSAGQHSDGTPLVAGDYTTPVWSGNPASGKCGTCHGVTGSDTHGGFPGATNSSLIASGKHTKHLTYTFGISDNDMRCAICHAYDKTAFTTSGASCGTTCHGSSPNNTTAKHANYEINVNMANYVGASAGYSGSTKPGDGYGSCSSVYCHSDGQATPGYVPAPVSWSAAALSCTACHGNATTNSPAGTALSGKHAAHVNPAVNTELGIGNGFGCVECHQITAASNTTLNAITGTTAHVNKFVDYTGLKAGGPARYNSTTKQCSNFYCHSNAKAGTGVAEFKNPPVWSSATTLGCNGCHGNNTVFDAANPTNANLGQPNYTNGGAGAAAANSHKKHVIEAGMSNTTGCYNCHSRTVDKNVASRFRPYSTTHVSGGINIAFSPAIGGTYTPGVGSKTCASTACHGAGTPQWGGASLACNSCHSANNSGYWAANSSHRQHWEDAAVLPTSYTAAPGNSGTATTYRFQCSSCHASTASHSNLTNAASSFGSAEVFFGYTSSNRKGSYSYAGSTLGTEGTIKWTAGNNCNTTYCHSDGNGGAPRTATFTWNSPDKTLRCDGCHGSDASKPATIINTGLHRNHIDPTLNVSLGTGNLMKCVQCHAKTVSFANNTTLIDKTKHVNKFKDYSGQFARGSASYNGGTKSCSNLYCHSNAKAGAPTVAEFKNPPAWNSASTLGCNGCHGNNTVSPDAANPTNSALGQPNYTNGGAGFADANSHKKHVVDAGLLNTTGCYSCHAKTVDKYLASKFRPYSTTHVSGGINIVFSPTVGGTYTPGVGSKTCASTACHGAGTPQWGGASLACNACHSANNSGYWAANSSHIQHWEDAAVLPTSYTAAPGNTGTAATYRFQCSSCHASPAAHANLTNAASTFGSAEIFFGYTSANRKGTYTYAGSTFGTEGTIKWTAGNNCGTTYCHSDGNGGNPVVPAFAWNSANGTLGCNGCHGDAATSGKLLTSAKHQEHVNNAAAGGSFGCVDCHAKTVSNNTTIFDKTKHVNKFKDYSGAKAYKSGYTVGSAGSCTTYCHSTGKKGLTIASVVVEPVNPNWSAAAPALNCKGCHGASTGTGTFVSTAGEPNYPSQGANVTGSNSHQKHVGSAGAATCVNCHGKTTTTGTTIIAGSQHLDKFINYTAGNGKTFYRAVNKTCNNISCHFNGTAQWGATLACNACHGGPTALGSNIIATNKHAVHVNNLALLGANYTCGECHAKTLTLGNDSVIATSANHANGFNDYSGVRAYKSGYTVGSLTTCTTYCHSSGKKGLVIASVVVEPVNPSWNAVAQPLDCKGCHGVSTGTGTFVSTAGEPNYPNQGANVTGSNSHQKHVGTAGASTCINCHSKTTTTGTTLVAGGQHIDNFINYTAGNGKTFNKAANRTCNNISCHFNGTAQWGATLACNACHGGPTALGSSIIATNKHSAHVNNLALLGVNYTCGECHAKTVTVGNDTAITTSANHSNGFNDYSSLKAYKSGYTVGSLATCTTYCHSSGKKAQSGMVATVEPANPSWNAVAQPLDCKGCHGAQVTPTAGVAFNSVAGEPNYTNGGTGATNANSHQKHVGAAGAATCDSCHTNTTTTGLAIKSGTTIHTDKNIDVTFNTTKAGAGVTWTQGTKTCSTACHGKTSPRWGEATTGCNFCHPYDVGSWNTTAQRWTAQLSATSEGFGAHEKHITHLKTLLGLSLTPLTDTFGAGTAKQICGACHTNTAGNHMDVAAGNARSINFGDSTFTYGLAGFDLKFGGNATYGGTSATSSSVNPKNCLNTSCHTGTAPVWATY